MGHCPRSTPSRSEPLPSRCRLTHRDALPVGCLQAEPELAGRVLESSKFAVIVPPPPGATTCREPPAITVVRQHTYRQPNALFPAAPKSGTNHLPRSARSSRRRLLRLSTRSRQRRAAPSSPPAGPPPPGSTATGDADRRRRPGGFLNRFKYGRSVPRTWLARSQMPPRDVDYLDQPARPFTREYLRGSVRWTAVETSCRRRTPRPPTPDAVSYSRLLCGREHRAGIPPPDPNLPRPMSRDFGFCPSAVTKPARGRT
ncbi:hypothetical protein MLGJGCBP_10092 [Rhodococcus sp. T7]|nr:hypothetical protein MLGJGCBP_10092 [Rhodococcus sp. T7]